jgi:mono/diheme cytochrome c family protein
MKTIFSSLMGGILVIAFGLIMLAFTYPSRSMDDWPVPEKYKTMKNPYAGKADADGIGKNLFKMHCASCHGKEGHGDGTKAAMLESDLRDFASTEVQSQSDGAIYYKGFIGKDEMPNFEKKVTSEEDRWMLVNFIRTLK